jgi:hypothetical protein
VSLSSLCSAIDPHGRASGRKPFVMMADINLLRPGKVQRPLATVVIGGIMSGSVPTPAAVPALYRLFEWEHDADY